MRGSYRFREWEKPYLTRCLTNFIQDLVNEVKYKIDLTSFDINPYNVKEIMPELGWEYIEEEVNNHDFWWYFRKGDEIIVFSFDVMDMGFYMYIAEEA